MSNTKVESYTVTHQEEIIPGIYDTYSETRYRIVDVETGEVLDDAQGYGYKSYQNALSGWGYKSRDKSRDPERIAKEREIMAWMKEHRDFVNCMDDYAFLVAKGDYGPNGKVTSAAAKEILEELGYTDLPFTAKELFNIWKRGPIYAKKKRR